MRGIYEPEGRAKEYADLAINLCNGCTHGCTYCFVPTLPFWRRLGPDARHLCHSDGSYRSGILKQLGKDCERMRGDPREILFCFTCDPFQVGRDNEPTIEALRICEAYNMRVQVLTKGNGRIESAMWLLAKRQWKFATTLTLMDEGLQLLFEPNAARTMERIVNLQVAHCDGIPTWVSLEPIIDVWETIYCIEQARGSVDLWKVGKINHDKELEASIDWHKACIELEAALRGENIMIKDSLKKYWPTYRQCVYCHEWVPESQYDRARGWCDTCTAHFEHSAREVDQCET